jgi:hypothetical protein
MLAQTIPAFDDVEHGGRLRLPNNAPPMKTAARSVAGRLKPATLLRGAGVLVRAQQVVGEAHAQERTLGDIKVLHAEALGLKVIFEFLYSLLAAGALVVVTPEPGTVALPIGDENPENVATHIDEPTSDRAFVFTDALTDGEKFARG